MPDYLPTYYCTTSPTEPMLVFGSIILFFIVGVILGGLRERGKKWYDHD